jgi:hypothetical protein
VRKSALFVPPVVALLASPLLVDCKQLEIHCDTAKNCLDGQICVSHLCQDKGAKDGGGTGGEGGSGGASGTGGEGGTGTCPGGCAAGKFCDSADKCVACTVDDHCGSTCVACHGATPRCDGTKCVACTQKSDCSGLTPCCTNNVCSLLGC